MLEINTSISLKKVKEVIDELGYGTRATRENVQGFFDDVVTMNRKDVKAGGMGCVYLRNALEPDNRRKSRDGKVQCGACCKIISKRSQKT